MNQLDAMRDTLLLLQSRFDLEKTVPASEPSVTLKHFVGMLEEASFAGHPQIDPDGRPFSEAKLGRWLGWIQGAATARGLLTLEEAQAISRKRSKKDG
jgi:hypothetical protein